MIFNYKATKLVIQHPREPDVHFTGILEQVLNQPNSSNRLAVVGQR